ncbi:hypothetical protein DEJ23_05615 [Curtobacterium sp. MCSS17_008]|uniref:hypothetical protein n=1 Tax=Curtobacterium sp. MCSS17_008 TaxID=2175647 RepID=UPI000DA8E21A|nr:hypothetical protein [Curtobacterium sp. MCSS17_008]PZF58337.1 hypothetical protein DEJ23_05615 [Curtobacterium sp. MCSS17_008]
MSSSSRSSASTGRPVVRTTYAPPVAPEDVPVSRSAWRRVAGLTDPSVLAAHVRLRTAGLDADAIYEQFFRP